MPTLLIVVWTAALLLPATGHALVIESATVTRDPKKGDRFTVKGEIGGLAMDGSPAVSLELAGVGQRISHRRAEA